MWCGATQCYLQSILCLFDESRILVLLMPGELVDILRRRELCNVTKILRIAAPFFWLGR